MSKTLARRPSLTRRAEGGKGGGGGGGGGPSGNPVEAAAYGAVDYANNHLHPGHKGGKGGNGGKREVAGTSPFAPDFGGKS